MASLYIHIPFCVHKCDYCDFVSFVCDIKTHERYIDCLIREMSLISQRYKDKVFDTMFFGGGTPSALPCGSITKIMLAARKYFNIVDKAEITIECNPGTVCPEKFDEYISCGINRISFGLQTVNDALLKKVSRIHSYTDFITGYRQAQAAGFTNMNFDLIYGLPNQTVKDITDAMNTVRELEPCHVSAYSLIMEEHTPLYDKYKSGMITLPSEDEQYEMHKAMAHGLQKLGFARYEISNYAKTGYECRHNLCYWDSGEYVGIGLNAASALWDGKNRIRYNVTDNIVKYMSDLENDTLPYSEYDKLSPDDSMYEFVMVGLRKINGFLLSDFKNRFGVEFTDVFGQKMQSVKKHFVFSDGRVYLTEYGLDIQNIILCELL